MDVIPWSYYYFFGGLEPVCLTSIPRLAPMTPPSSARQQTKNG